MSYLRKHPYLSATVVATLLSIVVWLCVPKEYAAITKVSDEYKEVDLAIGLNKIQAQIRDRMGLARRGINDMEIYSKWLKTDEFACYISRVMLQDKGVTYGEWLMAGRVVTLFSDNDTISEIKDKIDYNYSSRHETLVMRFSDRDPVVAYQVLDSITHHLQDLVTEARRKVAVAILDDNKKKCEVAEHELKVAQTSLADYRDSHFDGKSEDIRTRLSMLEDEVARKTNNYNEAKRQLVRQKALTHRCYCSFAVIRNNTIPLRQDTHPIAYILCINIIVLLLVWITLHFNKKRKEGNNHWSFGDLFSPWFITLIVWGTISLFLLFDTSLEPTSNQFKVCLSLWLCIFCPMSLVVSNVVLKDLKTPVQKSICANMWLFDCLLVIAILFTPLYLYQIYKIVSMFNVENLMMDVRQLAIHGDGYGILNMTYVIDEALLLVGLWLYPRISKLKLTVVIILWIVFAMGSMAKGYFFMLFIFSAYIMFVRKVIKIRTIVVFAILLVILFFLFNLARGSEDYQQNATFLDFVGMYILSPPVAFGRVSQTISDIYGQNVLSIFNYYENKLLGTPLWPHEEYQDFVCVPVLTNVYTIFRPYYADFGYGGVAFFAFILGCVSGYLYGKSKNGDSFSRCIYTYVIYVLCMQFFDDVIVEGTGLLIKTVLLVFILVYKNNNYRFSLSANK